MKKLLLGIATALLMASCSGNGASETTKQDSAPIVDSIEQETVVAEQVAEQVRQDSLATADKAEKAEKAEKANAPSPNAKEIDKLLLCCIPNLNKFFKYF